MSDENKIAEFNFSILLHKSKIIGTRNSVTNSKSYFSVPITNINLSHTYVYGYINMHMYVLGVSNAHQFPAYSARQLI